MMKSKIIIGVVVLVAAGAAYWGVSDDNQRREEDASLVFDRAWVDSLPGKDKTKYIQAFVVAKRLPFGVVQKASRYRLEVERFGYKKVKVGELALTFPQTNKRVSVRYTIFSCNELPGYDLCLELASNPWGGPNRYYGKRQRRKGRVHAALELLTTR